MVVIVLIYKLLDDITKKCTDTRVGFILNQNVYLNLKKLST